MFKTLSFSLGILTFSTALFADTHCPQYYARIPGTLLCIAKYEMKEGKHGEALSLPEGRPWINISHSEAIAACLKNGKGYDLVTNDIWTKIARDIAHEKNNWNTIHPYHGILNIGHSDGHPDHPLEASSNDNDSCYGTGQRCSLKSWNTQRRTHVLSNGEVIWDFAGNVAEWIKERNDKKQIAAPEGYVGPIDYTDKRYQSFGPDEQCAPDQKSCGLGFYWTENSARNANRNAIGRSGFWKQKDSYMSGVFSLGADVIADNKYNFMGFRCTYHL